MYTGISPSVALPNHAPASHLSSTAASDAPLTSTQIAALGVQPLPPDHPFYSEVKAQIYDPTMEIAASGKSVSLNLDSQASMTIHEY